MEWGIGYELRMVYEYANMGNESSEMSELRFQISDGVIASEERARQSRGLDRDCFGLRPRNDGGYGAPALGIGAASFFAFRKKDIAESQTRRGTPKK